MTARRALTLALPAVAVIAVIVGVGIGWRVVRSSSGEPAPPDAAPNVALSRPPSPPVTAETRDKRSPLPGVGQQALADATGTMVAILRAHARGDTTTVARMAEESAVAQLSSYPRDGFDIERVSCSPGPADPTSEFTCTLEPSRKPLGAAEARLQRRGDSFVLVAVVPLVT